MTKDDERKYTFLGFAQKAGKAVSGENTVEAKIKEKNARCVVVAADAPDAAKEKFERLARRYHVPFLIFGEKNRLGAAIGKSPRNVVLISDKNIAGQILQ
ncbi:MAG: L7Ae/L30e/S12e/Gadd45 family ribosomal protein [Bacillota bacterium]|jgi:ribosomal protein L7Ae-like RNA K-turn-binding protein